jgi:3',5'-cyclic AMP phosphodiesterase CpdA
MFIRTLVHLSDVHFGRTHEATVRQLVAAVQRTGPDVVVVSGDLTQRARRHEFERARDFLDSLPGHRIVVPGNHDVPLHNLYARFFAPLDNYRRYISEELEPSYFDDEVAIVSLNTARSMTVKGGRINNRQISRIEEILRQTPPELIRIIVSHHPFDLPERYAGSDLVGRARIAMGRFARSVDVFLAGHFHLSYCGGTAERYSFGGHSAVFVQAGTACSNRSRGEANSFNVLRTEPDRLMVETHSIGADDVFHRVGTDQFQRIAGGWQRTGR